MEMEALLLGKLEWRSQTSIILYMHTSFSFPFLLCSSSNKANVSFSSLSVHQMQLLKWNRVFQYCVCPCQATWPELSVSPVFTCTILPPSYCTIKSIVISLDI